MEDNKITFFAETDTRNKRVPFGIRRKDRSRHVYVIGKTGMGKSTMLENMAVQDIQGGEGMAFIDPHGKTADLLLDYVPQNRIKDVVVFAPFDTDYPISFNVMEDVGQDKRHLVSNGLMSAFKKIWVDAWSARMEYILNNILLALLEYPDSTLIGVNRMLSDKEYRKKVVDNISDPSVKAFWTDEFAKYGDRYMQEAGAAIQNKIGQFISNPLVRNIIGQPKSTFDLRKLMDEKKIVIINLSKGRVGETNANLLGSMLITKIYLSAMSRADKDEAALSKLPHFYLYVDEFQSFANESFADILSEARKYKLNLTIAHQYIEQMSEEVRAAVFGNVGTMVVFRVGAYDAEVLEKEFSPTFTAEDLVNLGFIQIYLKLMIDGVSSPPFSARTLPPIAKSTQSFREEIMASSRGSFARPRAEVEKEIRDWHAPTRSAPAVSTSPKQQVSSPRPPAPVPPPRPLQSESVSIRQPKTNPFASISFSKDGKVAPVPVGEKVVQSARTNPEQKPHNREKSENQAERRPLQSPRREAPSPIGNLSPSRTKVPSEKNLSDLRAALAQVVNTPKSAPTSTPTKLSKPTQVTPPAAGPKPTQSPVSEENIKSKKPQEIPEDVLRKMLEVNE